MCEIKSFEQLLEAFDMEGARMHLEECAQCREQYSAALNILCPRINTGNVKIRRRKMQLPYFVRKFAWIGAIGLLLLIFYPRQTAVEKPVLTEYAYMLEYDDYLDIVDNMDDEEFWALYDKLEADK